MNETVLIVGSHYNRESIKRNFHDYKLRFLSSKLIDDFKIAAKDAQVCIFYGWTSSTSPSEMKISVYIHPGIMTENDYLDLYNKGMDMVFDSNTSLSVVESSISRILSLIYNSTPRHLDFTIDPRKSVLSYRGQRIFLSKSEIIILQEFSLHQNLLTHQHISTALSLPIPTIRVIISRLARKLQRHTNMRMIRNRYGVGYELRI